MSCESCKADCEQVHMSAETARVVADMTAKQDRTMKIVLGLWIATVAIMAAALVWTVNNVQAVANEAVLTALETVEEMDVAREALEPVTEGTGAFHDAVRGKQPADVYDVLERHFEVLAAIAPKQYATVMSALDRI